MGGSGEEVVDFYLADCVVFLEERDISGLGAGIAAEIDDGGWFDFVDTGNDILV